MTTINTLTTPMSEAVRAVLTELLNTSAHHDTASAPTLTAIAQTRRDLAALHGVDDPAARRAPDQDRHAALSSALGDIGTTLLAGRAHRYADPLRLRAALLVLAATTLGWLDALLTPDPHYTLNEEPDPHNGPDNGPAPQPF